MRQKYDLKFAKILGRLAIGELNAEDILWKDDCGKSPVLKSEEAKLAIRLIWTNSQVAKYNNRRLKNVDGSNQSYIMLLILSLEQTQNLKNIQLYSKNLPAQKIQGLSYALVLQIGIRYMITSSIDVVDGLFNGATETFRFIELTGG